MKQVHLARKLAVIITFMGFHGAQSQSVDEILLDSARAGNSLRLGQALIEANPNSKDEDGTPAIVLAAKSGDFESVKLLLWRGANADAKDAKGKSARDVLDLTQPGAEPLDLIIRCYSFLGQNARLHGKVKQPELVVINDNYIDHTHSLLKDSYLTNNAELRGKSGIDDDSNGFIDDVYGWNVMDDKPSLYPQLAIEGTKESSAFLSNLMSDFQKITQGLVSKEESENIQTRLTQTYTNPLVSQIGYENLYSAKLNLNDWAYANMLFSASHGTHVAGIVKEASGGVAKIHGCAMQSLNPSDSSLSLSYESIITAAKKHARYEDFALEILIAYRNQSVRVGRRASDYLKNVGAGVVNMSWTKSDQLYTNLANSCISLYKEHGNDPNSMAAKNNPRGLQGLNRLALEFKAVNAAAFALTFAENPDILFVIAAGNDASNNDLKLPAPAYLSRFLPNVLTIASHNKNNKLSSFSNYGIRSVQLAANGEAVESSLLAQLKGVMSGTSMAAPRVAGVASAIRKQFPQLSASEVARILIASATKEPSLAKSVLSSGVLNPENAIVTATNWKSNSFEAIAAESALASRERGPDTPQLTKEVTAAVADQPSEPANKLAPDGKQWKLTNVAGFSPNWKYTASTNAPLGDQVLDIKKEFNIEWVKSYWEKGFHISSVAGDANGWNIVMSNGVKSGQKILGYKFDQQGITDAMKSGSRMTHVAGWQNSWVFIFDDASTLGEQRYSTPTPFNDKRKEWVQKLWKEGYAITSVAGDDQPKDENDGFIFVMSKNSGYSEQSIFGPGPWPEKEIAAELKLGKHINNVAGYKGAYIVVMSKGIGYSLQESSPDTNEGVADWIRARF